ncbi:F-box protein SKIP8-like [Vitis vinifera]|uniref:F-box protein SKIP8-like n=1 Tax=Vitis vinifera TaxID=29760 RepID=UPI00053F567B|nr:F-box protein SKIP8-like [Vitis vinifera]|eukprot:XP_010662171.1 PREDICTED: F-box protein SKIP8-like [Vitis vinifera]
MAAAATYLNGGAEEMQDRALVVSERQTGASMMEQLVPEITTHALSYLDYPSLCRLLMTNSLMRKAANDDNAWKALYHKKKSWNYKGKLMLESAQAFIEVEI